MNIVSGGGIIRMVKYFKNHFELKTIFRQKDNNYIKILNQKVGGKISKRNSFW